MTPDEHLNQLEPLLSETLAILDRHTAQLKQHTGLLNQLLTITGRLVTIADQQSENICFILREQAEIKIQLGEMQTEQVGMKAQQTETNGKLDLILNQLGNLNK